MPTEEESMQQNFGTEMTSDDSVKEEVIEPEYIRQMVYEEVYNIPEDCVEIPPPSFYRPQWTGTEWIESGEAPEALPHEPSSDEKIAQLEADNADLKNSVSNLEDMIVILTMP